MEGGSPTPCCKLLVGIKLKQRPQMQSTLTNIAGAKVPNPRIVERPHRASRTNRATRPTESPAPFSACEAPIPGKSRTMVCSAFNEGGDQDAPAAARKDHADRR